VSPRNRNRLKLIGIGLLAVAPVLGSYLLYWFWLPSQHTNYGTLIEPRLLPATPMPQEEGAPFSFDQLRGRWVFVVIDGGACDSRCQEKLWQIRQVRQAQGKELARIERVWLIDDQEPINRDAVASFTGTWLVRAAQGGVMASFPAEQSERQHLYLVDPRGYVMMRYPQAAEPKRIIKDLSRLLKYSRVG
jgi:cytochrome oxidase Cu insertion factor (SCO1/SenC/PrrC family)